MELALKSEFTIPQYVFVYGTLKRGYGNNQRCLAESEFVGTAFSVDATFTMHHIGFPIIWEILENGNGGNKVTGEIFCVSPQDMIRCDRLEGHPRMYKREVRPFVVTDKNGATYLVMAWVYLWQGGLPSYANEIKSVDGTLTWTPPLPNFNDVGDNEDDGDDDEEETDFDQSEADAGEDFKT